MSSRCRNYAQPSQKYVPVFKPNTCPDTPNQNPKRFESYKPPTLCRSEPLSHSEYLRKLVQNSGVAISSGRLLQQGPGIYKTTNWMGSTGSCIINQPVPNAMTGFDESLTIMEKGGLAANGHRSKYDLINTNAEATTLRLQGQTLAAEFCNSCSKPGFSL